MSNKFSRSAFEKIASPEAVAEFDAGVARARLKAKIAEQDAARGRPLTDEEKLQNLAKFMEERPSSLYTENRWLIIAGVVMALVGVAAVARIWIFG